MSMMQEAQLALGFTEAPSIFRVSDLAGGLRELVESAYDDVLVEGELSNFKLHRSGHCYFTLKDDDAQIRCVMWRHFTQYVFFEPRDGMLVRLRGTVSLYEARGDLQIVARSMRLAGEGSLQKSFEELKRKLAAEGLFDEGRKRPLPAFPSSVGVVTSGTGAAIHDIVSVLERRFPAVRVVLCPVQVQGIGSADQIAAALRCLNDKSAEGDGHVDVIIVGRGGGSVEDLWAFNEEVVARAIAASRIPVVSAVGHETDFSIADFVADRRAATPSMAAEIVVPDQTEVRSWLRAVVRGMGDCLSRTIDRRRLHVQNMMRTRAIHRPRDRMRQQLQRLDDLSAQLRRAGDGVLSRRRSRVEMCLRRLELLDPARPLARGFVRVQRDGRLVRRADDVRPDDQVTLTFFDGVREATITR